MQPIKKLLLALILLLAASAVSAAELRIAVAANFNGTMQQLAPLFEKQTGHKLLLSSGSSGAFYAQIQNGAPFDVFFSADSKRPELLAEQGLALAETVFIYAQGIPVLWSTNSKLVDDQGAVLKTNKYRNLGIAHPENAPYGLAAQEVLTEMGIWDKLNADKKIIRAQNIGQAYSQAASGAVELGFVALSQIMHPEVKGKGSYWIPSAASYSPILQKAAVLETATDKALAKDFLAFVRSPEAAEIIKSVGYGLPNN
ncbi:molybdate ABC transporter substrate-binding protein [Marinospirillum insulare]|uniref:Molybdate ABC transporter substrate-binding protein n=1 Tax=Marinospirillum insulare TaxID=217169 RepID=A0ABQ6A0Z3_9GAMM|nr:molybdate ABC transporter substrate-binding protein [Marinospirillum insulare]GLR64576.1 molybdate ABC transporter substrate-binding protein [Marinospirillum insulare]